MQVDFHQDIPSYLSHDTDTLTEN